MSQLDALGYTVENADRDSGFIRGCKQTSGAAAVNHEDPWRFDSGNETDIAPSDSGEADPNRILETCAEGVEGVSGRVEF